MVVNAADRKSIRAAEKASRLADRDRGDVIRNLMSTSSGRRYIWDKLTSSHIFATSYSSDPIAMAFAEGERNAGLLLLNDIIQWCPEQFILAMRESNERRIAADRIASAERSSDEDDGRDAYRSDEADTADGVYRHPGDDDARAEASN